MTGDTFHNWTADPSLLNKESIVALKELTERYPYFRTPQLLLAKALKDEQHIDQRKQLHKAAIYTADRKLLFGLLEGTHPVKTPVAEPLDEPVPSDKAVEGEQRAVGAQQEVVGAQQEAVGAQQETVGAQQETVGAQQEAVGAQQEAVGAQQEAVGAQQEAVEDQYETVGKRDKDVVSDDEISPETKPIERDSLYDLIPEPLIYRIEDVEFPEPTEPAIEPSELSFDEWLEHLSDSPKHKNRLPSSPSKKDNMALIDDFLTSQPNEVRAQRAEFFKPSKAAERSNQTDFTAISETLATIYEQQGKYELAIKAFDALALKYPSKSSYFAARKSDALAKLNGN